jgi:hypothetical protein
MEINQLTSAYSLMNVRNDDVVLLLRRMDCDFIKTVCYDFEHEQIHHVSCFAPIGIPLMKKIAITLSVLKDDGKCALHFERFNAEDTEFFARLSSAVKELSESRRAL